MVERAGGPPGSCDMLRVVDVKSSPFIRVSVVERLHVPPFCARAFAWSRIMLSFSCSLLLLVAFPSTAAALPAPAIEDELPAGPVDVAPNPIVDADVPPAAALPADPTVPLPPADAPAPTVEALGAAVWAKEEACTTTMVMAAKTAVMLRISILLRAVDRAAAAQIGDDGLAVHRGAAGCKASGAGTALKGGAAGAG